MKSNILFVLFAVCTLALILAGNASASSSPEVQYKVQRGDTLSEIAQQYHGKNWRTELGRIAIRNNIQNPNLIIAGRTIVIPDKNTAIKKADVRKFKQVGKVARIKVKKQTDLEKTVPMEKKFETHEVGVTLTATGNNDGAKVVKKVEQSTKEMAVQKIETPTGLVAVAPTVAGNDGIIAGTSAWMEFKYATGENYIPATSPLISGLSAGDYVIRYSAVSGFEAGPATTITVPVYVAPIVETVQAKESLPEIPIEPIKIIYAQKPSQEKDPNDSAIATPSPVNQETPLSVSKTVVSQSVNTQTMPVKDVDSNIEENILSVNGEIGYAWGCLDMFGKCQTFGGSLDVYRNSESVNKFGLYLGAELSTTNMTDVDSNLKRLKYAYFAGLAYKLEPNKSMKLVIRNGVMFQQTKDDINSVGGLDLSGLGIDFSQMGIDLTKFNATFKREQSGYLFYNKIDYSQKSKNWRWSLGSELRIPLAMEFNTDLPADSMGSKKLDQSLALLRFGLQRKVTDNLFVGIETLPVFYSGETNLFGAMVGLSLDWKMIALKGGALMHPYGLTKQAIDNGGSFKEMLNAYLSLMVEF